LFNAHNAYRQCAATGQTRVDLILGLYEAIIDRLEKALAALRSDDHKSLQHQVAACTLGVGALAGAYNGAAGELAFTFLRLFEFVGHCLRNASETNLLAALNVLRNLQEGFIAIRAEARDLERTGQVPPLTGTATFQTKV
jgi:flagellar secretion chaperone FliS